MQTYQFAKVGKANTLAMARDFLKDGKSATERLHTGALPIASIVVDIPRRWLHEFGDGCLVRIDKFIRKL